ncbi:MAG: RnfABCDGE type electron transport complex subunit D [Chloroflexota bacterium]|nr:RnfABCDGE type electron transport complex subunit D [Chloroflexota bacterium]
MPGASLILGVQRFLRTPKGALAPVFLVLLALAGPAIGWSLVVPHVLAAVAGACLMELLIVRLDGGRLAWPSSALLSGLIVAFVLGPETHWAVTACLGILATISKHLLATRRWHIFNPAALALIVSIPLFGTAQSWWGALPDLAWPFVLVLLGGGALVVDRINKFPLVLSFTGTYFGLFTLAALGNPTAVAEMFRAPFVQSALFMGLFMLTDPPTSPSRYADQIWIGVLVGITTCVAQLLGAGQAYLLIGLLAGNTALAARRWLNEAQRRPLAAATSRA